MSVTSRLESLKGQSAVIGIDFIYVYKDQVTLDIYFHKKPGNLDPALVNSITIDQIRIYCPSGSEKLPKISVIGLSWINKNGQEVLHLKTKSPGDFTIYKLFINNPRIDRYYNDVPFSFKANCKSNLDCKLPEHECPIEKFVDFPVDYQARDFWSFRRALMDFASQRYPDWQDRLEADAGMMLLEVMSALGDGFAYYQDRIARETYLETASQRRSLRRHARLVDYNIHDGLGASTWLLVLTQNVPDDYIEAGADIGVLELSEENGSKAKIIYEVGRGLKESMPTPTTPAKRYEVKHIRNSFNPHRWDENGKCLSVGTTDMYIEGHYKADLHIDVKDPSAGWVLLKTYPENSSIPERAIMVRLIEAENIRDTVFNIDVTHLVWEKDQALPFELDMITLKVHGNMLPVTAGETKTKFFVIGVEPDSLNIPYDEKTNIAKAIERYGPNSSIAYFFSLTESDSRQLVWLMDDPNKAIPEAKFGESDSGQTVWLGDDSLKLSPEIILEEVEYNGNKWEPVKDVSWKWKSSLLGSPSSNRYDKHYTLDDGVWKSVVKYQRSGSEIEHIDYASGAGFTIRFGDGEFGSMPHKETIFRITYRLGNGKRSNLPAGSLKFFEKDYNNLVEAVTNPLPSENGIDPQTPAEVRKLAPDVFRSITYRAVRPEDYAEAAERLSWVQRAGATFRWTGSWLSAFVTPDPKDSVTVSKAQQTELMNQLNRFRQAGREAHTLNPVFANIDLEIKICVATNAYRGEVEAGVREALLGKKGIRSHKGFFSPDNFTFGTPLDRSRLEADIQDVPGVNAVKGMLFRRRGWFDWRDFAELSYKVDKNEIIRIENDPLHPERGSLKLTMEGGA